MATSKKATARTTTAPAAAAVLEIPTQSYVVRSPILYDGGTKRAEVDERVELTDQEAESLGDRVQLQEEPAA